MLFQRPFTQISESSASLKLNLGLLRRAQQVAVPSEGTPTSDLRLPTWDSFAALLGAELAFTLPSRKADLANVLYSTNQAPETFGNALNATIFQLLKEHDATKAEAQALRAAHEAIEAAKPPLVVVEKRFDENGEEIPEKPKSKRVLREEAEQKKKDIERLRKVVETEHRFECMAIKLKNAFQLNSIRVALL